MTTVDVDRLVKQYDKFVAVNGISFTVSSGEFFGLLGPSGCGKTTTLYCIAGLETPTSGRILFDGKDVTGLPTQKRNIGMVFQSYAIFYNMTVYDNLAYPLRIRRMPASETRKKVHETAELLGLKDILNVKGAKLTPAQMQLVSLGRAIIYDPSILFLDEPLSNLDPSFRMETLRHIKRIQRLLKITTIFVTHDQLEALSACDRLGVMQAGKMIQLDRPEEIYYRPATVFVAGFVGTPPMNLLEGKIERMADKLYITSPELANRIFHPQAQSVVEEDVIWGFKPEDATLSLEHVKTADGAIIQGRVRAIERTAAENIYLVDVNGKTVKVVTVEYIPLDANVFIHVPLEKIYIYSKKTGMLLDAPRRLEKAV
jgi:ABC-type sugar transport system ATPase subunit